MFGPEYTAGCPACSAIADGFNGFALHLANHDVMLWAVSEVVATAEPMSPRTRARARHERVRARGRRRLPHLLGVLARGGWPVGSLPVALPSAARRQRHRLLESLPRRVRAAASERRFV